jgi:hypothetical protein
MKIVVFDLDETLGYFSQFSMFWYILENYIQEFNNDKKNLTQIDFNRILDLYPEYLRPNIINVLNYLKKKKHSKCCNKMMIYTNNTGSKEWASKIIAYFEEKINEKLIDQIIAAFKVNGKVIEICRTTHDKTHNDLIKCSRLPVNSEICFIDDTYYPEMANDNVYYIHIKPYYHDISFEELVKRFIKSKIVNEIIEKEYDHFEKYMLINLKKQNYKYIEKDAKEDNIDKIIGKYLISHLHMFFNEKTKNETMKKRKVQQKNKTYRNLQS